MFMMEAGATVLVSPTKRGTRCMRPTAMMATCGTGGESGTWL